MTYEDLIVAIANEVPKLSGSALKLLLRLIATGIETGSCEVTVSKYWLAERTGLSREGVTLAAREIAHVIGAESTRGVSTTFVLPTEWFTPQRTLFPVEAGVDFRLQSPGNQATTSQVSRRDVAKFPGGTRQVSRLQSPTFLAGLANFPGESAQNPGDSRQETRLVETQNQQLTDVPSIDRSDSIFPALADSSARRVSIERINFLPVELEDKARELKRWLRGFFGKNHPTHTVPVGPDEQILAKCLAIAPYDRLVSILQTMNSKGTPCGDSWAWFVTVFCRRVHGLKPTAVDAPAGFYLEKKNPSHESGRTFAADLLQDLAAGVGRTH